MSQLVERSVPTPEVRASNPVTRKLLNLEHLFTADCIEKTRIKKRGQEWPIKIKIRKKHTNPLNKFCRTDPVPVE